MGEGETRTSTPLQFGQERPVGFNHLGHSRGKTHGPFFEVHR